MPGFSKKDTFSHPPFKFCIAVAGFRPRGNTAIDALMEEGIETPVLHVLGINDQIVSLERAQTLVDVCRQSRVEKHEGGKRNPSIILQLLSPFQGILSQQRQPGDNFSVNTSKVTQAPRFHLQILFLQILKQLYNLEGNVEFRMVDHIEYIVRNVLQS